MIRLPLSPGRVKTAEAAPTEQDLMRKMSRIVVLALFFALQVSPTAVEVKTVDGVKRVLNPAKPIKGTVTLELEKSREIDPMSGRRWD